MKPLTLNPEITPLLTDWYTVHARDLPWRQNREPYNIWLSEIMLQQTTVETVIPYYLRFLSALPDIPSLAEADEEKVLKLWEGLGYYSRARNLQKAARIITQDYAGIFPTRYGDIIKLPGVGVYTAGAIASICFDQPTPAVDGNVLRVITRVEGLTDNIDSPLVKKGIHESLVRIYPPTGRGDFTQSLMELGATVCMPNGKPRCAICPVGALCKARADNSFDRIPIRNKKKEKTVQDITVLLLLCDGKIALRKRGNTGLLPGLWEFPNVEGVLDENEALKAAADLGAEPGHLVGQEKKGHIFTHIRWRMTYYCIACDRQPDAFEWAGLGDIFESFTIPTAFKIPARLMKYLA
ncbi:MAG: A/G-specific adenine glycosylase [Oscillospiraceae bacterium]|nr:A/G-specific adenine glycosylase [Oscillospiraceae bacterium]